MSASRSALILFAGFAFLLAGCGGDPYAGRMEVSGTASLKKKPLPDGAIIQFEPLENQNTAAMSTFTGGAFKIPRENGLKPGKYLVRLSAGDGKTPVNPVNPDEPPGPSMKGSTNIVSADLIPPDWGIRSKQQVSVTPDGPNKFVFDIP